MAQRQRRIGETPNQLLHILANRARFRAASRSIPRVASPEGAERSVGGSRLPAPVILGSAACPGSIGGAGVGQRPRYTATDW